MISAWETKLPATNCNLTKTIGRNTDDAAAKSIVVEGIE